MATAAYKLLAASLLALLSEDENFIGEWGILCSYSSNRLTKKKRKKKTITNAQDVCDLGTEAGPAC